MEKRVAEGKQLITFKSPLLPSDVKWIPIFTSDLPVIISSLFAQLVIPLV